MDTVNGPDPSNALDLPAAQPAPTGATEPPGMTRAADGVGHPDTGTETGQVTMPASPGSPSAASAEAAPLRVQSDVEAQVIEALKSCFDPEIPVNIYELGLIYSIEVTPERAVAVRMTLTSPMCPVAGSLPPEVEAKIRAIPGAASAAVEVVWEPPWNPSMMSEAAKLQLNMM